MAFSSLRPFTLNQRALPRDLGVLRLVALSATAFVALQWIATMLSRVVFNGGRVYESDETFSLWPSIMPWPVFSVLAWLTIVSVSIGCLAAAAYLYRGGPLVRKDMPYVVVVTAGLCGGFPWLIATFNSDPTGIILTPGENGYPIGWHWIATPLALFVVLAAITGARRSVTKDGDHHVSAQSTRKPTSPTQR